MIKNQEYKNAALAALKGHWTPAVIASILFLLISLAISGATSFAQPDTQAMLENPGNPMAAFSGLWPLMCFGSLASLFLLIPIEIGFYYSFLLLYRHGDDKVTENMFREAFRPRYGRNVLAMFLMGMVVMFVVLCDTPVCPEGQSGTLRHRGHEKDPPDDERPQV